MQFQELIEKRYSVREYLNKSVEEEKINAILEAGRLAPTGKNSQPQEIYVIKSKEGLEKLKTFTRCAFNAPVVFLICGNKEREVVLKYNGLSTMPTDVAIVQTFMMLKATDLGLGSCWVAYFKPEDATRLYDIPEGVIPYGLLFVGYYDENLPPLYMHNESLSVTDFTKYR